jgi:PAS domain S-box-containing protein
VDNVHPAADLGIRVRELTLRHEVTRILQREEPSPGDSLDVIARAIQRSWPHADTVAVRARLGTYEVTVSSFDRLSVVHHAEFVVADGRSGTIDIAYAGDVSTAPDHLEQQALLEDVAEMFRTAIDRRLVIAALRQSEQRYRSVVEHQSDLVCRYLPDTTLTFVNEAYCRFAAKPRDQLIGRRFVELIPELDRPAALDHVKSLSRGGEPRIYEHSVLLPDGSVGRQQWVDHGITSPEGRVEELQGIGRDITDRWRAEEALRQKEASLREAYERIRSLAHRLILAQEAERTEIARDLHDDVSQQLAALGIGLSLVEARLADHPDTRDEIAQLRQVATGLAEKVRHVSHSLHPGVLQHAGLSAAIASHCEAIDTQHTFNVRFETRGNIGNVPADVALCLYRAVQQALRNVATHSNASRAWVMLARIGNRLELTISDNGRGFEPEAARACGLGLLSIEERAHLVNGRFKVTSRPGGGARLTISVPIGWI